jgi:hypothetical protein
LIATKERILRVHLLPAPGGIADWTRSCAAAQVRAAGEVPKAVNNVLAVLSVLSKRAVEWAVIADALRCWRFPS